MTTFLIILIGLTVIGGIIAVLAKHRGTLLPFLNGRGITGVTTGIPFSSFVSLSLAIVALMIADRVILNMYPGFGKWLVSFTPFSFCFLIIVGVMHVAVLSEAWKVQVKQTFTFLVMFLLGAVIVIGSVRAVCTELAVYTFGIEPHPILSPTSTEHLTFVEYMAEYNEKEDIYTIVVPVDVGGVIVIDPVTRKSMKVNFGNKVYIQEIRIDSIVLPQPAARFPVGKLGAYQLIGKGGKVLEKNIKISQLDSYKDWKIEHPENLFSPCDESFLGAPLAIVQGYASPIYEKQSVYYPDTVSDRRVMFSTNMPKQWMSRGDGNYIITFSFAI